MQNSFMLDDITFEGVTYDPTSITNTLQPVTNNQNPAIYNLNGQRIQTMQQGNIYIVNDKKIIKK